MVGHEVRGPRPDGSERTLWVSAADRPWGGPQRLAERAGGAWRDVFVEPRHRLPVRRDLIVCHLRDERLVCPRGHRVFGRASRHHDVPSRADSLAQRSDDNRWAANPQPDGADGGVHEQGLARLDAKSAQVTDESASGYSPVSGISQVFLAPHGPI